MGMTTGPKVSALDNPPVIVLGCGRSGTSIFGELFDGLGPYTYESEPAFERVLARSPSGAWAVKVPRESEGYPADEGLSFPVDVATRAFPALVLFWIVRHPLDAIASLRVGIGANWRHHPRPPDWEAWLDRPLVEQCAHHWTYVNGAGFRRVRHRVTVVHFESMIAAPFDFATRICEAVGLSSEAHEPTLRRWARRVQNTNNAQFVEAMTSRNLSRADHSVRVGRWQENLSSRDVAVAASMVSDVARQFGYGLSDIDPS